MHHSTKIVNDKDIGNNVCYITLINNECDVFGMCGETAVPSLPWKQEEKELAFCQRLGKNSWFFIAYGVVCKHSPQDRIEKYSLKFEEDCPRNSIKYGVLEV